MKNDRTQRHNTDDIEAMKGLLTEEERKDLIIEETKKNIEFKPIIPFDDSAGSTVPAFPVESLPGAVQDFVLAAAASIGVPVAMTGSAALGVLAAAVQKKAKVKAKGDWTESLCLYILLIARSSERKSPIMRKMTKPIELYEEMVNAKMAEDIEEYDNQEKFFKKKIKYLEGKAARGVIDYTDAQKAREELAALEPTRPLRLTAGDVTPEVLVNLLEENNERMAIFAAEGGLFGTMSGRYSGAVNIDVFLNAYSQDKMTVDRVGRRTRILRDAHLTMVMAVQPHVVCEFEARKEFQELGLTGRFLYAMPDSLVGTRNSREAPDVPPEIEAAYCELVTELLAMDAGIKGGVMLEMTEEARDLFFDFDYDTESRLTEDYECIEPFAGKVSGTVLRMAGILHYAAHGPRASEISISRSTVAKAIDLAEYYLAEKLRIFNMTSSDAETQAAAYVLKRILTAGKDSLTKREIAQRCKGKGMHADDVESPLALLAAHHYLVPVPAEYAGTGRRSIRYFIHPELLKTEAAGEEDHNALVPVITPAEPGGFTQEERAVTV